MKEINNIVLNTPLQTIDSNTPPIRQAPYPHADPKNEYLYWSGLVLLHIFVCRMLLDNYYLNLGIDPKMYLPRDFKWLRLQRTLKMNQYLQIVVR